MNEKANQPDRQSSTRQPPSHSVARPHNQSVDTEFLNAISESVVDGSVSHRINLAANQLVSQWNNASASRWVIQSINKSARQSVSQCSRHWANHAVNPSDCQSVCASMPRRADESASPPNRQSASQFINQPANQPVSERKNESVGQCDRSPIGPQSMSFLTTPLTELRCPDKGAP